MQKRSLDTDLLPHRNYLRMHHRPNVKCRTGKPLQDHHTGENLDCLESGNGFLGTPKALSMDKRINEVDCIYFH